MSYSISKKMSLKELLIFSFPSVITVVFMSFYTIVDGFFIARYVGSDALSGLNIAYPCYGVVIAAAIMFGTGGSAYVSHQMGQGKTLLANQSFTFILLMVICFSLLVSCITYPFINEICVLLGAEESLLGYAHDYLLILMIFCVLGVLQFFFTCFLVTASQPKLSFWLSLFAGIINIFLDYLFIVIFKWGIKGAAYATIIGCAVPSLGGLIFFLMNKKGLTYAFPNCSWEVIIKTLGNGSSEMVANLSISFSTILINRAMMKYLGSDGVAAFTAALYCDYLMISAFFGFAVGIAPHISYHFGAKNILYLKNCIKKCLLFVSISSVFVFLLFLVLKNTIVSIFFQQGTHVFFVAETGLFFFAFSFLFKGINLYGSALFTALGNGKISAFLAFMRTFVFILINIYVLSFFWQETGLWFAIPLAEAMAVFVFLFCKRILRKEYQLA